MVTVRIRLNGDIEKAADEGNKRAILYLPYYTVIVNIVPLRVNCGGVVQVGVLSAP